MKTPLGPWDIKLITRNELVEVPHSFTTGMLWWKKTHHTITKELRKRTEAYIVVRFDRGLYVLGMCDKGFGFVIDNRQLSGDLTAGKVLDVEVIKPYNKGDWDRFNDVVGRKDWQGTELDSFKAVAYILGDPHWRIASLLNFKK